MKHKLPQFKSSEEAVAFGRTHATADIIAALRARSKRFGSLSSKHGTAKQYTIGLRYAFKEQLDKEAIEFALHPNRLTLMERIRKEKEHANVTVSTQG